MVPVNKILFCTDFSQNSEPARQIALDYAKAFGAELVVVHVIDSAAFETYKEWVIGEDIDPAIASAKRTVNKRLEQIEALCRQQWGKVKTVCKFGLPSREIVGLARDESANLIVLGTHGRTGVRHLLMGSVARSVLKMAHRPVLIVEGPRGGESSQTTYGPPAP